MNLHRQRAPGALLLLLASCSSHGSAPHDHGPVGQDSISAVTYVGVTDEALVNLLDFAPKDDPRYAVIVDSPDLTLPVPKDTAATLRFHLASEATRTPSVQPRPAGHPRSLWQRSVHEVLQFLSPERIAHAHGAPYNGTAYYLVITDAGSNQLLRVFTNEASFTPEADWQTLVQAPQPLSLEITSAVFEDNDIPVGGGPFTGGTFPFRIE